MNDAETKTKNNESVTALQPDAWPSRRALQVGDPDPAMNLSLRSFRNEAEIHAIHYALQRTGWNRKRAARLLSISYRSLLYKIRRHNIAPAIEQS
jgi:transcriptional regulator with GAF, ATPase, and Fis domain